MFNEIKKIVRFTGKSREFIFLLILRTPFDIAFTVVNAMFLQHAFIAVEGGDISSLTKVCLQFGFATVCLFMYNGTIWSIYAPFVTLMEGILRRKLFVKIASFSCKRMEGTRQGEWLTRLNTDVEMPFSKPIHLPHAACSIINICVSSVILMAMDTVIFGWVMIFVVPHIIFNQLIIARAMPALSKKSLEVTASNTGEMNALITCTDVMALYDSRSYFFTRFEKSSLRLFKANMKIHKRNALGAGIIPLFGLSGYLVLLIVCSEWIGLGQLAFGDLTAAFQYRGGVLMGSLMLINSLVNIKASLAGIKRLNDTLYDDADAGLKHGR
jgi:ABC-type multidrug transport system fused ATPase/permease subunit